MKSGVDRLFVVSRPWSIARAAPLPLSACKAGITTSNPSKVRGTHQPTAGDDT